MKAVMKLFIFFMFPCLFFADNIENNENKKWPYHEYHNRISVFAPNHIMYERIKPNSLYAGVDAWATWAGTTLKDNKTSYDHYLAEFEFRLGYSFFLNGRDYIRPILGLGVIKSETDFEYHWNHKKHSTFKLPAVAYLTGGFMYEHEFNSIFNLGVNLKGIIGGGGSNSYVDWGGVVSGFDVSLPITFRFGRDRHWDLRLEPFNIFLIGSKTWANSFGGRGTFGYRF